MKRKFAVMLTYLLPVVLLVGCRITGPQDLRFESIGAVKLSELGGVWNAVQARSDAKNEATTLLKINFSSQVDFVKMAKAGTLHFSFRAFACDNGSADGPPLFVLPNLRIRNFSAGGGAYAEGFDLERFRESNGRFTYYVLMPIAGQELSRLFENPSASDQTRYFNPGVPIANICLRVVAASMGPGLTLQSNVVRVPAPDISRLIY